MKFGLIFAGIMLLILTFSSIFVFSLEFDGNSAPNEERTDMHDIIEDTTPVLFYLLLGLVFIILILGLFTIIASVIY